MRGFALGMVASWYQEDSWYRKFLDGLQTVADHRLFDMSKTLFMWYRTLNVLQEHYMTTALETINKEEDKIFAYIKYVSTVPRGSKEQKDADQYIRDLLNEVQRNDFLSWVILKNTNQGNTERIVEGVLMLPVLYEVACYVVNFGKVLWSIASDS